MLHRPDHPQKLLANAQFDWLEEQGPRHGWRLIDRVEDAQAGANRGQLVVAAFKNPQADQSGHIVIVRPAEKSAELIATEGPDIIQAGGHNFRRTSVRRGFIAHPAAFERGQILYFAHAIEELPITSSSAATSTLR